MVIAATKIIARNQIVLGDSIPYFSVVSFPVTLISSSEVTCDEFSSITGHQQWCPVKVKKAIHFSNINSWH